MPRRRMDWDSYVEDLADRILGSLDFFCWEISGDTPLDCYSAHSYRDPYELAEEFLGDEYSSYEVRERDLKLLKQMPRAYYDRLRSILQRQIEKVVRNLEKEYATQED